MSEKILFAWENDATATRFENEHRDAISGVGFPDGMLRACKRRQMVFRRSKYDLTSR